MPFRVTLPAIGFFLETKVDVAQRLPGFPESRDTVHSIKVEHSPANFACRDEARIRLLTHAQMYRKELRERNIKVMFDPLIPEKYVDVVHKHYAENLKEINELISILENPETIYNIYS